MKYDNVISANLSGIEAMELPRMNRYLFAVFMFFSIYFSHVQKIHTLYFIHLLSHSALAVSVAVVASLVSGSRLSSSHNYYSALTLWRRSLSVDLQIVSGQADARGATE